MHGKRLSCLMIFAAIGLFNRPGTAQDVLFSDTFSIQEGERPGAWEAVETPRTPRFWYVRNSQLASGPGQDLGGSGYSFMIINTSDAASWTNYGISTDFWMESRTGRVVLVARFQDAGNFHEGSIWFSNRGQSAHIYRVRNGERQQLAYGISGVGLDIPAVAAGTPDELHNLQLRVVGSSLGLYLDGKRLVEAVDDSLPRGRAGVGVRLARVSFDNVRVETARIVGPTVAVRKEATMEAGATQVYRFLMGTFDSQEEAAQYRRELVLDGYINVTVEPADNKWDVLVGAFGSEAEALHEQEYLESQNVAVPRLVVRTGGTTQVFPVARRRAVAPDKAYTLLLGRVATKQEADELKRQLELDGFFGAQVRADAGAFTLALGSFRSQSDAERYRKLLEGVNYKVDRIAEEKPSETPGPSVITPSEVSMAIRRSQVWQSLTEDQQKQFQQIIQRGGTPTEDASQYYMDLKTTLDQVRLETRNEISKVIKDAEERRAKEQQVAALIASANTAVSSDNFDQARASLEKVSNLDPGNAMVALIRQQIQLRERSSAQAMAEQLNTLQRADIVRQVDAAKNRAERFQAEGYFQNALLEFEGILDMVSRYGLEQPSEAEINQRIKTLRQQVDERRNAVQAQITEIGSKVQVAQSDARNASNTANSVKSDQSQQKNLILIALGGLGAVTLILFWIFFSVRRRNRMLLEQMRSLTLKPMMEISGSGGGAASLGGGQASAGSLRGGSPVALDEPNAPAGSSSDLDAPPADPSSLDIFAPSDTSPLTDLDTPSEFETPLESGPAPTPAPEPPAAEPEPEPSSLFGTLEEDEEEHSVLDMEEVRQEKRMPVVVDDPDSDVSLRLPEESPEPAPTVVDDSSEDESPFSMLEGTEEKKTAKPAATGLHTSEGEEEEDQIDLSISLGDEPPTAEAPSSALEELDGLPSGGDLDISEALTPPPAEVESTPIDLDMIGVEMPAGEAAPQASGGAGVFHAQAFDDEAVGSAPKGWTGGEDEYDFASLTVGNETPAGDSGGYLKFEKPDGKGSAYYSCKFPDATGQVEIEFDLRCDEKNKFLLGFYVEKDGDFRQSIHTIVHQPDTAGGASLRVQGEAIPYEMGSWRHVKYLVNLSTGRLTGYVDGETVLDDIRLTNCPRSLNTLSIRDNIPTTGVLLIDNIRIARG